jgi:hypothetical protein
MDNIIDSGGIQAHPPKKTPGKPAKKPLVTATIQGLCIGRDKKVIQPIEVEKLAALGCTNKDIALFFGIAEDNLPRHFKDQLIIGREQMKITLRRAMMNNACKHNNAALQIFLAKNLLGMSNEPVNSDDLQPLPWSDEE